jgi:hypothetical protein
LQRGAKGGFHALAGHAKVRPKKCGGKKFFCGFGFWEIILSGKKEKK